MMDKTTTRKPGQDAPSGDIHAQIAKEAAQLRNLKNSRLQDAATMPALYGLMDSARTALEQAIPARFEHEGKTYFLRASVGVARLIIFDTATAPEPLAFALSDSHEEFGHTPCH